MAEYNIVRKQDSKLMRAIAFLIKPINDDFMENYYTTIGKTIYTPNEDGSVDDQTLQHELVHIAQYNKWNILYYVSYLFLLPAVFTMRSYWEKQAYAVTIKQIYNRNPIAVTKPYIKDNIINQFLSSKYLWMWPFRGSMEKWYDGVVKKLQEESDNG